jgi:ethanolamine utilization protein EutQ (cupin superfamily)
MTNYDTNKDQTLDNFEAQKLWNDVQSYNYAGIVVVDVNQTKAWIAKFDTNKDGKITVGELVNAIKAEGPVSFQAMADESAAVDTMPNPADTMPAGEAPDSA